MIPCAEDELFPAHPVSLGYQLLNINGISSVPPCPTVSPYCLPRYVLSTTPSDIRYGYAFEDLTRSSITDDAWMLSAARIEARSKFDNSRSLPVESMDTQQKIREAEDVAMILRQNVVQGREVEGTGDGEKRYRTYDLHNKTPGAIRLQ